MAQKYKDKTFYINGESSFCSDEQISESLNYHQAQLAVNNSKEVKYFIDCGGSINPIKGQTVMSEMEFVKNVIFTAKEKPKKSGSVASKKKSDSTKKSIIKKANKNAMSVEKFLLSASDIPEKKTFTMVFVDPESTDGEGGLGIRSLFTYIKHKSHILFHVVGLTGNSDEYPLQHFGIISLSSPLNAWRFEEYTSASFTSQVASAIINDEDIDLVDEIDEYASEDDMPFSSALLKALKSVEKRNDSFYYIDDSDQGNYMLDSKHEDLIENNYWLEDGFNPFVYRVAESVLASGKGWALDH